MRFYNKRGMKTALAYLPGVTLIVVIIFALLFIYYPSSIKDVTVSTASSVISSLFLALVLITVFGNKSR